MKKLLLLILTACSLAAQQSVTVLNNGAGTGTFNTPGVTYYLAGPAGGTWDFSNVTVKGVSGGGGGSVSQIVAGTNVTISPSGGTGVVTINSSAGGGTPGGSTTQMQYNNAGAFGGTSGLTWASGSFNLLNSQTVNGTLDGFGVQNTNTGASALAEIQPAVNGAGNSVLIYQTGAGYSGTLLGNTGLSAGIYTNANEPFVIGTNSAPVLSFLGSGAATFSNSLTVAGLLTLDTGITFPFVTTNGILYTKTNGSVVSLQALVNILAYGADPTGVADSTTAIQNAINAVSSSGAKGVYIPSGQYSVSSLNLTGLSGFMIVGDGINNSRLNPNTSSGSVLDLTGSGQVTIRGIQVGYYNQVAVPKAAILLGQVASGVSTEVLLEDCYISGSYSVATLYDYGVPSSHFTNCRFYNYDNAGVPTVYLTASNAASITSAFASIATGAQSTSDLTFDGCEIHDFTTNSGAGPVWLDAVGGVSWFGGNISCALNGPQMVKFTTTGTIGMDFNGVSFYADSGTQIPDIFYISAAVTVKGLTVKGGTWQATASMFDGLAGSTYDTLVYQGKGSVSGSPYMIGHSSSPTAFTVVNALVDCDGENVNISTGSITQSILYNPGTVTATTNTAEYVTAAGVTENGPVSFIKNIGVVGQAPTSTVDIYDAQAFTDSAGTLSGQYGLRSLNSANETGSNNSHTILYGVQGRPAVGSTNTANWTASPGLIGGNFLTQVQSGAAGTITQAVGGQFQAVTNGATGATVNSAIGVEVINSTNSGTLGNVAGIAVASQTAAGTSNTDILFGSTSISTGGNYGLYQADAYNDYFGGKFTEYNSIATAGNGMAAVVSAPRTAANTNALWTPAAYTTPAVDTSYEVSANINVTAATTAAMTCTCAYTDETNTPRTLTLGFTQLSGATLLTSITNVTGTGPYESPVYHIRCKASTTITFATTGTVTSITYNAEATAVQIE